MKKNAPADQAKIKELVLAIDFKLPNVYLDFVSQSNGAEGELGSSYLVIWPIEELLDLNRHYNVDEFAPGFFLIGSDGGGNALAIDKLTGHIYEMSFAGMSGEEAMIRARDFSDLIRMESEYRMKMSDINDFWIWFKCVANDITNSDGTFNGKIIKELEKRIIKLADFAWQIGRSKETDWFLVVSPNLDKDLLGLARLIIEYAPVCPGWEFLYTKPPMDGGKLAWEGHDEDDKSITIDAENWQYILYQLDDGSFNVVIKADNLAGYSELTRFIAAEIALEAILGEEKFLMCIESYDVVDTFDADVANKAISIKNLAAHIHKITFSV